MIIPQHIGFIMDGNGRWAVQHGMPRSAGHKAGYEKIPEVLEICHENGIQIVSAYAWSTENWSRPKAGVEFILRALERHLPKFVDELHQRGVRFLHCGSRERIPAKALQALDQAVALTKENGPRVFNFAFNYGGRAELVQVARSMLEENEPPEAISPASIEDRLWSVGLPDVDLVIRTGGDYRTSNFMLWQTAFAVIYFVDNYWPAITRGDIEQALGYYNRVKRAAAAP